MMSNSKKYLPVLVLLSFLVFGFFLALITFFNVRRGGFSLLSVFFVLFFLLIIVQWAKSLKRYFFDEKIVFPEEILESGEKLLYRLDNVLVRSSARRFLILFSWSFYKTHVAITNKRIIFAVNLWGKLKFSKNWGSLWFDPEKETSFFKLGSVKEVFCEEGKKEPALVITGRKGNLKFKIQIEKAREVVNRVRPFLKL